MQTENRSDAAGEFTRGISWLSSRKVSDLKIRVGDKTPTHYQHWFG